MSAASSLIGLVLAAAVASAVLVAIWRYNRKYRGLRLPPGPPGWPVVGHALEVALSGKQLIHYVRDLGRDYGPIFTLRLGVCTLVVVTSAEVAREALVDKDQEFASRPASNILSRDIFTSNKLSVNAAIHGPTWRSLRRNMVSEMLSTSRLRQLCPARQRAMHRFVARMRADAAASPDGSSVWVLRNARFAVFCVLLEMTFGLGDLGEEHIMHIDAVMKRVLLALGMRTDDYLPFLRPFFWWQHRRALAVRREQIQTLLPLINRRRAILLHDTPDSTKVAAPFSYLDSLLGISIEKGRNLTDEQLVTLCTELINGGTDTTATAIEWAMARILDNPSIQLRLHQEIMQQVGDARRPIEEKDIDRMPYLKAFVKELLRKHPPTYFSLPHAAVNHGSKLAGYDVPTEANLTIFLPAISEDPMLWDRPAEFDPDRFLAGGEKAADITAFRMLPFGAGRRICPGMALATTNIALMVARMVQEFQWSKHPSQPKLHFKGKMKFTVVMDQPLRARVKPRNISF